MSTKRIRKAVLVGLAALLAGGACALGYCRWAIQSGFDECCALAQAAHLHPGDEVAAMLEYVQTDSHSLRDRDLVVWALGQARDGRALPILESYYTGAKCDHDRCLCQGELAKAIKLCRGPAPNLLFIKTP